MSTRYICDYFGCERLATYRIIARPLFTAYTALPMAEQQTDSPGIDTCDDHYEFTHPGRIGGGWWDDYSAPQESGKRHRDSVGSAASSKKVSA